MKLVELIPLLGAAQGIMLAVVIVSLPSENKRANWTLAAFIGAESIRLFVIAQFFSEKWVTYIPFYHLLHLSYAFGPLLYFYVRTLVSSDYRFTKWSLVHFTPILVATYILGYSSLVFNPGDFMYESYKAIPRALEVKIALVTLPVFLSLLIYSLLALHYLRQHTRTIKAYFSSLERINLKWLQFIVYLCLLTAVVSGTTELMRAAVPLNLGPRVIASVLLSVFLIYFIGFMGIRQPVIFKQRGEEGSDGRKFEPAVVDQVSEKYQKSGLTPDDVSRLWNKVKTHMVQEQPFMDNEIKLGALAEQLQTRPNYLSQVINSCAEKNFFEFINGYRIEEAKRRLASPECSDQSISTIATSVGFSSQNAFNMHFKKITATTPRKFRNAALAAQTD